MNVCLRGSVTVAVSALSQRLRHRQRCFSVSNRSDPRRTLRQTQIFLKDMSNIRGQETTLSDQI